LIAVGSLAESLLVLALPPPDTLAVFVISAAAFAATFTVNVIAGDDRARASTSLRVQVMVCDAMPHVQPVPAAPVGVRPAGTTSVTVMVRAVGRTVAAVGHRQRVGLARRRPAGTRRRATSRW
jgi:hypothetical protein